MQSCLLLPACAATTCRGRACWLLFGDRIALLSPRGRREYCVVGAPSRAARDRPRPARAGADVRQTTPKQFLRHVLLQKRSDGWALRVVCQS